MDFTLPEPISVQMRPITMSFLYQPPKSVSRVERASDFVIAPKGFRAAPRSQEITGVYEHEHETLARALAPFSL